MRALFALLAWLCVAGAAMAQTQPGPFGPGPVPGCPLAGCTLSSLTVTGTTTLSAIVANKSNGAAAGVMTDAFLFGSNLFGTVTSGNLGSNLAVNVNTDTVDASGATGGGMTVDYFGHTLSAGAVGGRTTFESFFSQTGATTAAAGQYYVSSASFAQAGFSAGGLTGASNQRGNLFAGNDSSLLLTGAGLFWNSVVGREVDVGVQSGTAVNFKQGMKVVQWASDAVSGSTSDYAYGIADQSGGTAPGWKVLFALTSADGWFAGKSTGSVMCACDTPIAAGPALNMAHGIDLSAITFSSDAFKSTGFLVDGSGNITNSAGLTSLTNGTSNLVSFAAAGLSAPTFTSRGAGVKVIFYPQINGSNTDYAMGISTDPALWFGVPQNTTANSFAWYGGTTKVATLDGTGVLTVTGGVAASGGFSSLPRNIGTCGMGPNSATSAYTAQTPVVTEFYVSEVFIPANVSVTGVAVFNSATISGNMNVGLANSSGVNVATSASTAMAGTSQYQRVAFSGAYAAVGPATYYVTVFYDNTVARPNTITAGSCGVQKATGQVFATGFTSFTPSGTFVTALGPVATLY